MTWIKRPVNVDGDSLPDILGQHDQEHCTMTTIVIDLPERLTTEIGALVESGWFVDETEIIHTALWEFMRRNRFALAEQFQRADIAWALQQHRKQQAQKVSAP